MSVPAARGRIRNPDRPLIVSIEDHASVACGLSTNMSAPRSSNATIYTIRVGDPINVTAANGFSLA